MERSTDATLPKVLISYDEFERLKHIEVKYIELQSQMQHEQKGNGITTKELDRLKEIEKAYKLLQEDNSSHQVGLGNQESEQDSIHHEAKDIRPPVASAEKSAQDFNETVNSFDVVIQKDDENTKFDEAELLTFIPPKHLKKAKLLLNEIEQRPYAISWNSSGTLFINSIAIPKTDIYKLFPALFKKKKLKLNGIDELVTALNELGLQSFIEFYPSTTKPSIFNKDEENIVLPQIQFANNVQWWYIGD